MSDFYELKYLNKIAAEAEKKLCWGNPITWKNGNFIQLGNEIRKSTGVRISADTLKRIFGKVKTSEAYNPQLATKDALAVFLGYKGWSDFKLKNPLPSEELTTLYNKPVRVINIPRKKFKVGKFFFLSLIAVALSLLVFWQFMVRTKSYDFSIEGKYLLGNAYHTVVFDYNMDQVPTNNIFLDFGDGTSPEMLSKNNRTISHYYRGPGLYHINLIIDKQPVYDTTAYLTTDGWEAHTFFERETTIEYLPIYEFKDTVSGTMSISKNMPLSKGIDTTKMYWVQYANFKDYHLDGDNFTLESELKNDHEIVPARCNHIKIHIIGENSEINLYFLREGCSKWVRLRFSEVVLHGTNHDLAAFGKDFLDFQKVTVKCENKNVAVFYNDSLLLEQTYQKPLGDIKGIAYIFSGVGGAIKSAKLNDALIIP